MGDVQTVEAGTDTTIDVDIVRSPTFFERTYISFTSLPDGWVAGPPTSLLGWTANSGRLPVTIPAGTPLGHYQVGIQATNQGRTETVTVPVDVVVDTPTANAPITSVLAGARMGDTDIRVRVVWPAATDPSSSIARYEVQSSLAGAGWTPTIAIAGDRSETLYTLKFDKSYRFRIRARDAAGNWSPWATTVTPTVMHPVDDRSAAISRTPSWTRTSSASAWHRTVTGSKLAGGALTMVFTGHGIALVGPRNPQRGSARIYIDGVYIRTVSMKSSAWLSRQVAFTRYFAAGGRHTITIRIVGGGKYPLFRLDSFIVTR
jgi:hypothetical protein